MYFPIEPKINLENYLDLLIDDKIDNRTNCPICIDGISEILDKIYKDLKENYGGYFQKLLKKHGLVGLYSWKVDRYPIPIRKLKILLKLWKEICKKSEKECEELYNKIFQKADYFRLFKSPLRIKSIKILDSKLAYLMGVIYADGSLRDIWRTQRNEKRFRFEFSIVDSDKENLESIIKILNEKFSIKTNVKSVYDGRWYRILFSSNVFHRFLNKVFEMPYGYKKGKLKIPKIIEDSPLIIKKYFLIGFMDGDGTCIQNIKSKNSNCVSISQSSTEILLDLKKILAELGFSFNLYKKTRDKHIWYVLETKDKKQIRKFYEKVGFLYPTKARKLEYVVKNLI
ncbi:MAG: LAGLIDADG family homing endonuclease [Nanoarchaeota archaeon]